MTKTASQQQSSKHEELFRSFGKAFMKKDVETVALCLSDDFVWSLPTGETFTGKEDALQAMSRRFADPAGPQFSDSHFAFHGDTIVQTYKVKATLPDGSQRDLNGLDVYCVSNGLISRKDAYWKQLTPA